MTKEEIDAGRIAAGWKRCGLCGGTGRRMAATELLIQTTDCLKCDGIGWIVPGEEYLGDSEHRWK